MEDAAATGADVLEAEFVTMRDELMDLSSGERGAADEANAGKEERDSTDAGECKVE